MRVEILSKHRSISTVRRPLCGQPHYRPYRRVSPRIWAICNQSAILVPARLLD